MRKLSDEDGHFQSDNFGPFEIRGGDCFAAGMTCGEEVQCKQTDEGFEGCDQSCTASSVIRTVNIDFLSENSSGVRPATFQSLWSRGTCERRPGHRSDLWGSGHFVHGVGELAGDQNSNFVDGRERAESTRCSHAKTATVVACKSDFLLPFLSDTRQSMWGRIVVTWFETSFVVCHVCHCM